MSCQHRLPGLLANDSRPRVAGYRHSKKCQPTLSPTLRRARHVRSSCSVMSVTLSPWPSLEQIDKALMHHCVDLARECGATGTPDAHGAQAAAGVHQASGLLPAEREVAMRDRVAPRVELFQPLPPEQVALITLDQVGPERHAHPAEVRLERPRARVAAVQ